MNEMHINILKVAGDFGKLETQQIASEAAKVALRQLLNAGGLILIDEAFQGQLEGLLSSDNGIEGNPQGRSLREETRRAMGAYVLTSKGAAALRRATGGEYYEPYFVDFVEVMSRNRQ